MKKFSLKTLLAILVFSAHLIVVGQAQAGYMGFTVESIQTDDSDGC